MPSLEGIVSKRRDFPYRKWALQELGKGEESDEPRNAAGAGRDVGLVIRPISAPEPIGALACCHKPSDEMTPSPQALFTLGGAPVV